MPINYAAGDNVRDVILTFDDGPAFGRTVKVLNTLASYDIKAIFFVIGNRLHSTEGQELVLRAYEEGHTIANHTYTHPNLRTLSDRQIRDELQRTHDLIAELVDEPTLFRPPYGATDARVDDLISQFGYQKVMWNVDTLDWQYRSVAWVYHGMRQITAREDSLVLMHDIHQTTADNVGNLIERIQGLPGETRFVLYDSAEKDEPEDDREDDPDETEPPAPTENN
jgi:peptidoglycan/xylan/chitin deacetylase (PgdA/CDA1 family)